MKGVVAFSSSNHVTDPDIISELGIRGERMMELAKMEIPILPGFVIQNDFLMEVKEEDEKRFEKGVFESLNFIENKMEKKFGDVANPLILKSVVSPQLNMVDTTSGIHNIGLCDSTVDGFGSFVGEEFAYHEYCGFIHRLVSLELSFCDDEKKSKDYEKLIQTIKKAKTTAAYKKVIEEAKSIFPVDVFENPWEQLQFLLNTYSQFFENNEIVNDSALMLQAMTFGNFGKESFFGSFFSRNIETGEKKISGEFIENSFDDSVAKGKDISKIDKTVFENLKKIAYKLECEYKEIRFIKFTVEDGKLWIIDQANVDNKSALAEIQTLLDLYDQEIISGEYAVTHFQPGRLQEILHPILDKKSAAKQESVKGGISGAMGAACGVVYFSTEALMKANKVAIQRGTEPNFILAMSSTYAEDVKAIEAAKGVITNEGGFASHAPVVARSLGKVAMVNPEIMFTDNKMKIGKRVVKEGDYIAIDVPSYDEPTLYFGEVDLIKPDLLKCGLIEFLDICRANMDDFQVRANVDQPKDAELAFKFGAEGIGLCRTEHMFFEEKRISIFRSLIIAEDKKERIKILEKLRKMQVNDFYGLFKAMGEHPVTIRLLDAPLHEFLPHTRETMSEFIKFFQSQHPDIKESEIRALCDMKSEVNPMLGHRGVRVAISYPEIYQMQVAAIFEAAYKYREESGVTPKPEIMVPVVMSPREVKTIRFGKKIEGAEIIGMNLIEEEVRSKFEGDAIKYKVGTMIEIPAACLQADDIARYADFFSFGTNDLTQTTNGLSRDDFNSFFTDYNEFDLLDHNPFQFLSDPVKELIAIASERGHMVRPDLKLGLCGEHGAEPENIPFCIDAGLSYVSCSPYGIPIAVLKVAQESIARREEE